MTLFFFLLTMMHIAQVLLAVGALMGHHWCLVVLLVVCAILFVLAFACLITFFLTDKEIERREP